MRAGRPRSRVFPERARRMSVTRQIPGKINLFLDVLGQRPDGYHELRVVAVDNTPIETQGRWIAEIEVNNQGESVQLSLENRNELSSANRLTLKVASSRNHDVVLLHNGKELGIIPKDKQVVRISTESLGTGPITLQARSQSENPVLSVLLQFELPAVSPANRAR